MCDSLLLTVAACFLTADFITGLVHWVEDTYGVPSWPVLGKFVVEPNIEHHLHPQLVATMSHFVLRNYQAIVPCLTVALLVLLWIGWNAWPVALTLGIASLGNEVHAWNHSSQNNWVIKFLQNSGLVQSPRQHAKHHRPPFDAYFCTLLNITNEVLEILQFWRRLEWFLHVSFGVSPKRMTVERQGV